jgi:peroxiredoxin
MRRATLTAAMLMLWVALPASGQEEAVPRPLGLGDGAPALDVADWVRGEGVSGFEPGRVYVLEFWSTGSRQSRAALSALSDLQDRFRDHGVTVAGITDEAPETVAGFLEADDGQGAPWGERVRYALAADPDGSVHRAYLAASGAQVPVVFVIGRDGKIEWIGFLQYVDAVVEAVVDGRWRREEFAAVLDLRRQMVWALRVGRVRQGLRTLDQLITMDLARSDRHRLRKFSVLLKTVDDPEAAYATGRELMRDKWDDANTLNEIAWYVVDEPGIRTRDFAFAMEAAARANELTEGRNPAILDTVARVYWEQGEVGTAIAWQYKAVQHAAGTAWDRPLRRTLERYERIAPAH